MTPPDNDDLPQTDQADDTQKTESAQSSRYLYALLTICTVAGVIYGNTQFAELPTWKATLGGMMFGAFLGLCAVNYTRLNW